MGEAISPEVKVPIHGGAINVRARIKIDEKRYEGAIPVAEVNKILREYLKPEHYDKIEIIEPR